MAPVVEFVPLNGKPFRVTSRVYSPSNTLRVGDPVTVAYRASYPTDAHLLLLREFEAFITLSGFTAFFILIWISVILISSDPSFGDPFRFLPSAINHFRLNPTRFPILFLLSVVIPCCGIATYMLSKNMIDLRTNGIKVEGYVTDFRSKGSMLTSGLRVSGQFPMIKYKDLSGQEHTIRGALVRTLSTLEPGDKVEIIYLALHPDRGLLNRWYEIYIAPIFFGSMMFAFLVLLRLVLQGTILTPKKIGVKKGRIGI